MRKIEQFYEPIGKMIVTFQDLEMSLTLLILSLVNEDPNVTMSFVAGMSFSKRIDALKSLAPFKMNPVLCKELDDLIKKIGTCEERRNTVVHSSWMGSIDGGTVFRHKPGTNRKKGLFGGIESAEIALVADVTAAIHDSHMALLRFAKKLTKMGVIKLKTFENAI